ncbi:zinc metalloprotease HtpX [Candidatus Woesearchaeota archaeon]|nr:zinc metalloprotease HtpX [Candidatus Woesearchaeota archaeon]MBT4834994.1 zinc metalloprotease HtpX [Candidatus Woesearchaeota archaeon]MBT6735086.1 zinc metalloprotease HtpX [Candidatus Woesearchaeota archaeon]MBT7169439.1 zinc metalloprotease HtpX [Candidatus Woesearchaeota archaeon]MBT7474752.1 zinc metalloprotease HtpX [Candidatus Woesearchaeota archaeon]
MFIDQIKTTALLAGLTFLLLIFGFSIGGTTGLTIALLLTATMNIVSYWYSDKLVLKMHKAKPANHEMFEDLHDIVKNISIRASIKKPKIFIINSQSPNAFATGRNDKNAVIAVTIGLLEKLSHRELKGVIAHEIAHIKNKDLLISTVSVILASAIAYIAVMARWTAIFGNSREDGGNLLEIITLSIVAPISASILRLAISRSREYVADETGAKLIKDPEALADALVKLETSPKLERGNRAAASLFIINPFSGGRFISLLSTHPETSARVKRLRKMAFTL